ncbi:MAG: ComEA family DNA-binding protein [Propionibacteriaceae bacterium]
MAENELTDEIRQRLESLIADRRPKREQPSDDSQTAKIFTRQHAKVVSAVVLGCCLISAWWVLRAQARVIDPVKSASPLPLASTTKPEAGSTPTPVHLVVHVVGAVKAPGLVTLPDSARIADAIAAAGGVTDGAVLGDLNLAEHIHDGVQIKIGTEPDSGSAISSGGSAVSEANEKATAADKKINLNKATQAQLEELPGVGPVMAGKIISWRKQHGKFSRIDELQEVDGVGPKIFAQISGQVYV